MQAYAAHPSQPNLRRGSPTSFFKVSIVQNNEIQGVYSCSVKSIYSANCSGTVEWTHSINSYTQKNFTLNHVRESHPTWVILTSYTDGFSHWFRVVSDVKSQDVKEKQINRSYNIRMSRSQYPCHTVHKTSFPGSLSYPSLVHSRGMH